MMFLIKRIEQKSGLLRYNKKEPRSRFDKILNFDLLFYSNIFGAE